MGAPRFKNTGRAFWRSVKTRMGTIRRDQIEVGHAAADQRMSLAEVVMDAEAGHFGGDPFARLLHAKELQDDFAQGFRGRSASSALTRSQSEIAKSCEAPKPCFGVADSST